MFRRLAVSTLAVFVALAATAGAVGAHVTVSSEDAEPGSFAVLTFRVPNEESDAKTVGLKVQLPPEHPIAFVSVQPKPGWTVEATEVDLDSPLLAHGTEITEAVSEVSWTGGEIPPGGFDEFRIQAGPLPDGVGALSFKAIQVYEDADGQTHEVAWIQEVGADGAEPEHPAPVLELTGASVGGGDGGGGGASGTFVVFAMAFGAAGLAMGVAALLLAVAARHKVGLIARQAGIGEED